MITIRQAGDNRSTLPARASSRTPVLRVAGLFAGIGGIELGLHRAGHKTCFLSEIEESAAVVLNERFEMKVDGDVRKLEELPPVDLISAGFPCQDLSSVGRARGIRGSQSRLVEQVFRLAATAEEQPEWLLFENVPFMLRLERGAAMAYLVGRLVDLGYRWAYRVVDTRAFGLPQRRLRVVLLASRSQDPGCVLFADDAQCRQDPDPFGVACGFYWTEGNRGLGWAIDAVPTLKGGSALGIASPPGIRRPDGRIVTPDIRDAERLQGFDAGWTEAADRAAGANRAARWKLVGNAVSVPVAEWVGRRLAEPGKPRRRKWRLALGEPWPRAAQGDGSATWRIDVGSWPLRRTYQPLDSFLSYPTAPLSTRATRGFVDRLGRSSLRTEPWFLAELSAHVAAQDLAAA